MTFTSPEPRSRWVGASPFADNPLRTRADVELAMRQLFEPLLPHFSVGRARVRLGSSAVLFGKECEEFEGFARPLFGLVPLALGGGAFEHWDLYREGLANGTDPEHPEYWGAAGTDQRMVEMAAIAFALIFVPELVWQPLTSLARDRLARWLCAINRHPLPNCNWHFFRVLVNLALEGVGHPPDQGALDESLSLLESHFDGAGFYHDGEAGRVDYYVPWAYHTYGLIVAATEHAPAELKRRYRQRAHCFAEPFQYWFDSRGRAIPFGRSQIYRFAQASFWSALAFADEPALPWGRVKGLLLRHLRYWARQAVADRDGVMNLGYAYHNPAVAEPYGSSGSPYWCCKAFLALALPDTHPFWQADEESPQSFEADLARSRAEPQLGVVIQRTPTTTRWLSAGQQDLKWPQSAAKYGKFAYCSGFGFGLAAVENIPAHGVHDSMLALRESTGAWRTRLASQQRRVATDRVFSVWYPWPDVRIESLLIAVAGGWHQRLHRVTTARPLITAEQGFALGRGETEGAPVETFGGKEPVGVLARTEFGTSAIVELLWGELPAQRRASLDHALPGTHLLHRRTVVPALHGEISVGTSWLACAVFASEIADAPLDRLAADMPPLPGDVMSWFNER